MRTLSEVVFTSTESKIDRARLKAAASAHSVDWLNAPSIASIGLLLLDEDIGLSVFQRLGVKACSPYTCECGKSVDARGLHALSCQRSMARHQRHSVVNDIIRRAVKRAKLQPKFLLTNNQRVLFFRTARDRMVPSLYHGQGAKHWRGTSPFPIRM